MGGVVTPPVLRLEGLSLGYPDRTLFRGLTMDLLPGQTLAVLGSNGSGKTSLVKALLGLLAPLSGRILWPAGRPPEIGYLGQTGAFDRRFPMRVRDLAAMGAWARGGGLGRTGRARVRAALEEVGIADLADRPLHALSGGQLQRALFARVIVQDAPLMLLDEPFAAVDQATEGDLLALIERWRAEGRVVLLVVHDLSAVLERCTHALLLGAGEAAHGTVDEIVTEARLVAQGYLSESQAVWTFGRRARA